MPGVKNHEHWHARVLSITHGGCDKRHEGLESHLDLGNHSLVQAGVQPSTRVLPDHTQM